MKPKFRPLHWTLNVTDRDREVAFHRDVLGMTMLRHNETAAGGQSGSRTLFGYGADESRFALELLHFYENSEFELGNDFLGITIASKTAIARAKALNWPIQQIEDKLFKVCSPQGYPYYLMNEPHSVDCDPIKEICLNSTLISQTKIYWLQLFGVNILSEEPNQMTISFGPKICKIRFVDSLEGGFQRLPDHGYLTMSASRNIIDLLEYRCLENNRPLVTQHTIAKPGLMLSCKSLTFLDPDRHQVVVVEEERYFESIKQDVNARNAFDLALQRKNDHPMAGEVWLC